MSDFSSFGDFTLHVFLRTDLGRGRDLLLHSTTATIHGIGCSGGFTACTRRTSLVAHRSVDLYAPCGGYESSGHVLISRRSPLIFIHELHPAIPFVGAGNGSVVLHGSVGLASEPRPPEASRASSVLVVATWLSINPIWTWGLDPSPCLVSAFDFLRTGTQRKPGIVYGS